MQIRPVSYHCKLDLGRDPRYDGTMKKETLVPTANRYRALATVNVRDAKTGRTKTYAKGSVIAAAAWKALSSSTRERFEPVTRGGRKAVRMTADQVPSYIRETGAEWVVGPDQLDALTGQTRDLAEEVAALWAVAYPEIPFPGVATGKYRADGHLTWWIAGQNLPGELPAMYATTGQLCRLRPVRQRGAYPYPYHTASLLKVAERLRSGRPVFAYDEATERLIDEIQAD
jgi:hypothetical protein